MLSQKLCTLVALVAPLASALIIQTPTNPTTGGQITIQWTNEPNDPPTWTFELINTAFNNDYAIVNNVDPAASPLTITLPSVPVGGGYTLSAVDIGNINTVYATTGTFSIGAATTGSSSGSSTSSSGTASSSGSASRSSSTTVTSLTSTKISTAVTPTSTSPSTSQTGTGTGTTATLIPPSSAGALSSRLSLNVPASGVAAVFLSAVAGAAMLAF